MPRTINRRQGKGRVRQLPKQDETAAEYLARRLREVRANPSLTQEERSAIDESEAHLHQPEVQGNERLAFEAEVRLLGLLEAFLDRMEFEAVERDLLELSKLTRRQHENDTENLAGSRKVRVRV